MSPVAAAQQRDVGKAWWRHSGVGSTVVATACGRQLGGGVLAAAAWWRRSVQRRLKLGSGAAWRRSARRQRQLGGGAVASFEEENVDLA